MIRQYVTAALLTIFCVSAHAELRPFINIDVGLAHTNFEDSISFSAGGGLQFHVELDVDYNAFDDTGPFGADVKSFSAGLNLGGHVSEDTRLFAIIGAERLEADDSVDIGPLTIDVDESSTEAYFGVGTAYSPDESTAIRTKLIRHDSGNFILTLSVGVAFYF